MVGFPKNTSSGPKYRIIADSIRADILAGRLGQNDRLPSFTELQARYGAATGTANQVYGLLEREGLVARERGRGVFVKAARREGTGIIALSGWAFAERPQRSYWEELFEGIQVAAERHGLEMLLTKPGSDSLKWEFIDGVLMAEIWHEATLARLPPGMPVVSMMLPLEGVASVTVDDYQGIRLAMDHLLALGHRRIAYLSEGGQVYWTRRRYSAYREALEDAGIEVDPNWLRRTPAPLPQPAAFRGGGKMTMESWIREGWNELGCTALLTHNDDTAFGALEALAAAGIRVPEDVSVIGFDGLADGVTSLPPLTSVGVPLVQIGALAVENLMQQMQRSAPIAVAANSSLPCHLLVRGSTCAPRDISVKPTKEHNE